MEDEHHPFICDMYSKLTDSVKDNQEVYKEVAEKYDDGYDRLGPLAPKQLASMVMRYYLDCGRDTQDLSALDVCSGNALQDFEICCFEIQNVF